MSNNFDHISSYDPLDERLARAERLTSLLGAETVKRLVYKPDTTDESSLLGTQPSPTNDLLREVEALGVELNRKMVAEIENSKIEHVYASIASYRRYYLQPGKVRTTPNIVFSTVLKNKQKAENN